MALDYILRRVASKIGYNNYRTNPKQMLRLLDVINEAAEEVWEQNDLPNSLQECILLVSSSCNEIALPASFGELRAVREKCLHRKWTINDMRPRYQKDSWSTMWERFRVKSDSPVQMTVANAAPVTVAINVAEEDVEVTIRGSTANSNSVQDVILLSDVSNAGVVSFESYFSISKTVRTDNDITIYDADGNVLAVLFNDELETRYIIVDVSAYPWGSETFNGQRTMEVLFKTKLRKMEEDSDTFPVPGWDNVIITKAMQLLTEDEEGKEDRAMLAQAKVDKLIKDKTKHKEGGREKEMQMVPNSMMGIARRGYRGEI